MSDRHKALMAIIAAALLWGTAGTVAKLLIAHTHPYVITFYRFGAAAFIMLPFFLAAKKPKRWLADLLPLGLFNAANVLLYYSGLSLTTANTGALLGAGVPILTALLAWILIHETISRHTLIGIIIGLIGAMLIVLVPVLERNQAIGTNLTGNLLLVGSVVAWSLYIIRSRSSAQRISFNPVLATFVNFASCTVVSGIASLAAHQSLAVPAFASPGYFGLYLYAVIGITVVTFYIFQWAVLHISATTASLKEYIQLVVGVTVNAMFLGERFTPVFFLGSILILTGVVIATGQRISRKMLSLLKSTSN